jgi:MFS family permease
VAETAWPAVRSRKDNQRVLDRLGFPSVGHHRRFVTAIAIDAIGSGVFMPISVLYFLATTDLSLVRVGAAISVASLVGLPAGPLIGGLVDRLGAKRVLLAGNLLQGVGFLAYLVVQSLPAVVFALLLTTLGRTAFWGSYGNIVAAISAPGERERWFGFLGALRNLGFALGGLASGVAISIGTVTAYDAVVVANAVSFGVAFALLLAVPPAVAPQHESTAGGWGTVLRDGPYRLLWLAQLAYSTSMQILNIAIPVYATAILGLPGWVSGAVFTVNCLLVGFGQGPVVRAMTGHLRWRLLVLANACFGVSFVVLLGASRLSVGLAVAVVLVGSLVYTLGELTGGPVTAALAAEAAPAHLRGRYLSLIQLAWNLSSTVTPVAFAWLLDRGAAPLWVVMLGVAVAGAMVSAVLGRAMPLADAPVTNAALNAAEDGLASVEP